MKTNKGGRPPGKRTDPKKKQIADLLLPHVEEAVKALVQALYDPSLTLAAAKEILDRVYGKPAQKNEITGPGGGPITFSFPLKDK